MPESNNTNNANYEGIKQINSGNVVVKDSIPSTGVNNKLANPKTRASIENIKNSTVSLGLMKIPCFEWKNDVNKGTKTAEYYLNIYYQKKKFNSSNKHIINNITLFYIPAAINQNFEIFIINYIHTYFIKKFQKFI